MKILLGKLFLASLIKSSLHNNNNKRLQAPQPKSNNSRHFPNKFGYNFHSAQTTVVTTTTCGTTTAETTTTGAARLQPLQQARQLQLHTQLHQLREVQLLQWDLQHLSAVTTTNIPVTTTTGKGKLGTMYKQLLLQLQELPLHL